MKKMLLLAAAVCSVAAGGAELIRNSRFEHSAANGAPAGWNLRDTKVRPDLPDRPADRPAATAQAGVLTLDTMEGRFEVMLIQFKLPLNRSERYLLDFDVRGVGRTSYRAVIHYQTAADGKRVWKNTPGDWLPAPEEWTSRTVEVALPADSSDPYFYFAANGIGKVEVRNVKLRSPGIELVNEREMPIYPPGETPVYQVAYRADPANTVRCDIVDFADKTVRKGTFGSDGKIELAGLPNGYYRLDAEEFTPAGKSVSRRSAAFAVIPEVPEAVRRSESNQFGVMVNPHTYYPIEQKELDAKYAERIGVKYIRTHRLNWARAQSGPDRPLDWSEADQELALYKKHGLRPVATIGWPVPVWASEAAAAQVQNRVNYFPQAQYLPALQEFYRQLATRVGDAVAYYEVGNEVDASNFWMGRLEHARLGDDNAIFNDFKEFYTLVASSVLAGNPDAKIGPGTTGAVPAGHTYKPWLERFWSDPEVMRHTNIFCPHYKTDLGAIREVMKKHGKEVPIVLTEIGGLVTTENYELTPALMRQLIKRTYTQYTTQLNAGGLALCKFLLRRMPEVREGWVSEMLDADFTLRPEFVAYATLIRLTGAGKFDRELNVTRNASGGWVEAYRVTEGDRVTNIVMLNDTDSAVVTLETDAPKLTVTDVMGVETEVSATGGKIQLTMHEDQPLFIHGEIRENPGPVKHPEPELVLKRTLTLANGNFELTGSDRIPGWNKVTDEAGGRSGEVPFTATLDDKVRTEGKHALRMSSDAQTRWYGVLAELPMSEIPIPKAGEYVIFKVRYDQKGENVVGTGAGLTLACRSADMRRVGFNDGNWARGTFDWTAKTWTSKVYDRFPRGTAKLTLEFYLGIATGTVWIDNVQIDVELYRKSNASTEYIN